MRILNSLYPYPVLSVDALDYNDDSIFSVDYTIVEATPFKNARLIARFHLTDPTIEKLIREDAAAIFIHVESPRAAYRKIYEVSNRYFELEINPEYMRTFVEVTGLVLATVPLNNFINTNINRELYGENYIFPKLKVGDPLAISFTRLIEIEEVNDFNHVSSIIKVAVTTEDLMRVDYDQDTIFIYLPEIQYENYLKYPNMFGEVMLSSIIQPALIYVLDALSKNKGEGMQDRKWYKVIEKKLEDLNYSMIQLYNEDINSIILSQEILKNPLNRMFIELEENVDEHV